MYSSNIERYDKINHKFMNITSSMTRQLVGIPTGNLNYHHEKIYTEQKQIDSLVTAYSSTIKYSL